MDKTTNPEVIEFLGQLRAKCETMQTLAHELRAFRDQSAAVVDTLYAASVADPSQIVDDGRLEGGVIPPTAGRAYNAVAAIDGVLAALEPKALDVAGLCVRTPRWL
jgi:hypothetical protein